MKKKSKLTEAKKLMLTGFIQDTMYDGAKEIATLAKSNAPRDTGALANSIEAVKTTNGAMVWTNNPAAVYQEYGTGRHGDKPFMRPAFESKAISILDKVTKIIKRNINQLK